MFKLPDSDKTAYLSLYVTASSIDAHLVYSDYSIGRRYTLHDNTSGDLSNRLKTKDFWNDYFVELEKVFSWDLFRGGSNELMYFAQEGIGVGVLVINIDEATTDSREVVAAIRSFNSDINIEVIGDNTVKDILHGLSERLSYDDIVYIKADLKDFRVFRTSRLVERKLTTPIPRERIFSKGSVSWRSNNKLAQLIRSNKLRAFMSLDYGNKRIENMWANFVYSDIGSSTTDIINDSVRSYITGQLLTIRNDNKERFEGVGLVSDGTAVILSGDLLDSIELEDLVLSIIDGLEIFGTIDLMIDTDNKLLSIAKGYSRGVLGVGVPISSGELFRENYKIAVAVGKGKKNERKVIFNGNIKDEIDNRTPVFGFSSEISYIPMPNIEKMYALEGKFEKGFKLVDSNKLSFISNPDKIFYKGLFVDGRSKPVVYGPDPRTNYAKLRAWLGEGIQ